MACPVTAEPAGAASVPARDGLPSRFLTVRVHELGLEPSLTAVCAGYEGGEWRAADYARHILNWVPDFALRHSERAGLNSGIAQEVIRRAVQSTFGSKSAGQGGVPGEILLHIVCRDLFGSDTVVSKVFFKTGANDEVKGFDGVHVVQARDGLELWLGEAKFYASRNDAVRDALKSVRDHLQTDYLRSEFNLITPKIDDAWPYAAQVRQLIDGNASLDQVFDRVTIPVLLAYESPAVQGHRRDNAEFRAAFLAEMRDGWARFSRHCSSPPLPVRVRLFLAPLASKQALVRELDRRLVGWS
jgi:hypothetical protein